MKLLEFAMIVAKCDALQIFGFDIYYYKLVFRIVSKAKSDESSNNDLLQSANHLQFNSHKAYHETLEYSCNGHPPVLTFSLHFVFARNDVETRSKAKR